MVTLGLKDVAKKLRDWLPLIVLGLVCFFVGKSCQKRVEYPVPVLLTKIKPIEVPKPGIPWKEKLAGTREARVETVFSYPDIVPPVPSERILSLDWNKGRLTFLSDSAKEYVYHLPKSTYMFAVRARDPGFMVKYRRAWWDRRLVVGGLYPLDAFVRVDITFWDKLFLQGEVTTKDWRVGGGWRVF